MTRNNWSVPETEVLQRVHERLEGDGADVLATIVDVEGNAYRRPGAKMLLDEAGEGVGAITAGCLEDDLLAAAESVREHGQPELLTYDLMDDEDDVWGLGVGCNGIIDVLLEPLTETYRPAIEAFADGRDVAVLTVLEGGDGPLSRGDRVYYHPEDGELTTPDGEPATAWPETLAAPAASLAERGRADIVELTEQGQDLEVFIDGLAAPTELVVFGSGHDVGPVTELAAKNDFRVTVVGFRGSVDLEERFPDADETLTTSPAAVDDDLTLDERTYAVVMTHNFIDDRLTVEQLLDSSAAYIGLMGPHDRFEKMLTEFDEEGRTFDEEALSSLYTPIGLDLGGGSPYQIAHSIVAEVLAVSNDRAPQHLKAREGHIHDRITVDSPTQ
ncbi:XdhC family protein [Natronorubrum sulfidifaciens]|uniref:Xanthine and Co dehydrogenase maturation factor n=1 Tax=Natronorubrum sulfidifaciens JCM 14089 TaxID=1230460 RepID=L9W3J7_9EURY|nr:XdhC/CoxI family protein [Natronorubrum sulfidifaciens]ELY43876.1 xanthine and Co dehydrogenase maturation factor [Natronorubrum sulfidifaciens JCM 14089]